MKGFEGVFTKRGESESTSSPTTGVFQDVFVRRGRWRKNCDETQTSDHSRADVVNLAEHLLGSTEYPMPKLSDITETGSPKMTEQVLEVLGAPSKSPPPTVFDVKNTFVNAAMLDFDSLQDFLKERKVKSCPASRQVSNVTMLIDELLGNQELNDNANSGLGDEILNTASSFGGVPLRIAAKKDVDEDCNDVSSMPSGSGNSDLMPNEAILNTASTFTDSDFELLQQRTSEVSHETHRATLPALELTKCPASASFENQDWEVDDQAMTAAEDRLSSLRMKGSVIQQRICQPQPALHESQSASGATVGTAWAQQPSNQFLVSVQTAEGIVPGIMTLLGGVQQEQTPRLPASLPNDPQLINATSGPAMAMPPLPPPPAAAPVLRLAEAIAPPELGGPELPSIGSLLHHKGECKPCTFFHTRGCENKEDCKFCHLCGPREKKKRLKALKTAQREANFAALENGWKTLASYRAAEEQGFPVDPVDMIIE